MKGKVTRNRKWKEKLWIEERTAETWNKGWFVVAGCKLVEHGRGMFLKLEKQ